MYASASPVTAFVNPVLKLLLILQLFQYGKAAALSARPGSLGRHRTIPAGRVPADRRALFMRTALGAAEQYRKSDCPPGTFWRPDGLF